MNDFASTVAGTDWTMASEELQAWYRLGNGPLIGAILALSITNTVAIFIAVYQQRSNRNSAEDFATRAAAEKSLEYFYDPLHALLSENREVFNHFGPRRISTLDHSEAIVAKKVWDEMKSDFISPNNTRISEIIQTKSHLLGDGDNFYIYLKLKLHIDSFAVFQKVGSEIHEKFKFPKDIEDHFRVHRENQIEKISSTGKG